MKKNDTHIQNLINKAKLEDSIVPKEYARRLLEMNAMRATAIASIIKPTKVLRTMSIGSVIASVALLVNTISTSNINNSEVSKVYVQNQDTKALITNIDASNAIISKADKSPDTSQKYIKQVTSYIPAAPAKHAISEDASITASKLSHNAPAILSNTNNNPVDISGINPIKLTKEEIEKLGFVVENGGGFVYYEWDNSNTQIWVNTINHPWGYSAYCIRLFEPPFYINPALHEIKTINPNFRLISNQDGEKRVSVYTEQIYANVYAKSNSKHTHSIHYTPESIAIDGIFMSKLDKMQGKHNTSSVLAANIPKDNNSTDNFNYENSPELFAMDNPINLNELLPIEVEMIDENGEPLYVNGKLHTLIIWFEPTLEFIEKLPTQIKHRLSPEIEAIPCDYETCPTPPITGGRPHFDVWRACSGAVENLKTYPTPVREILYFKYNLSEDRQISMYVCNLSGEVISTPIRYKNYNKGCIEDQIDVGYLNPGMYLLVINSDNGENAVQRFLVK